MAQVLGWPSTRIGITVARVDGALEMMRRSSRTDVDE